MVVRWLLACVCSQRAAEDGGTHRPWDGAIHTQDVFPFQITFLEIPSQTCPEMCFLRGFKAPQSDSLEQPSHVGPWVSYYLCT